MTGRWGSALLLMVTSCVLGLLVAMPGLAGADTNERSASFFYNDYTTLWWGHSDVCAEKTGAANDCFYFEADPKHTLWRQVSVPTDRTEPRVLVQEFVTERWSVFNTKTMTPLARVDSDQEAIQAWKGLGLEPPFMAEAEDPFGAFQETGESFWGNTLWGLAQGWPLLLAGLALAGGLTAMGYYLIRYQRKLRYKD
jgi:hypothetical protein